MAIRYAVYGGELIDPAESRFKDLGAVEFVGWFPTWEQARDAWKARAWMTVDNALMRFFIESCDEADLPPVSAASLTTGKERRLLERGAYVDNPVFRLASAARHGQDLGDMLRADAQAKYEALTA